MTFEGLLITVVYHMCLQMAFSNEGETAKWELTLKWSFISLYRLL